jgi:hypothetical protein
MVLCFVNSVTLLENTVDGGQYQNLAFVGSVQYSMVPVLITYKPSSGFLSARNLQQHYSISI